MAQTRLTKVIYRASQYGQLQDIENDLREINRFFQRRIAKVLLCRLVVFTLELARGDADMTIYSLINRSESH
jgi:hypothetical protein